MRKALIFVLLLTVSGLNLMSFGSNQSSLVGTATQVQHVSSSKNDNKQTPLIPTWAYVAAAIGIIVVQITFSPGDVVRPSPTDEMTLFLQLEGVR